jgi:excisionase family DNA binding protein
MLTEQANPTDLLKPAEVATQLGVSRTWLYDAAKAGRIPAIRIGGEDGPLRFVREDLERWIDDARAEWTPGRPLRATPSGSLDLVDIIGQPGAQARVRRRR